MSSLPPIVVTLLCVLCYRGDVKAALFDPLGPLYDQMGASFQKLINRPHSAISHACRNDTLQVIDGLSNGESWALQMYDSMGKADTGLLTGSFSFIGYYEECLKVSASLIDGTSYCLATTSLAKVHQADTPVPAFIWNKLKLDGSIVRIGLCVPNACSEVDIKNILRLTAKQVLPGIEVTGVQCQSGAKQNITKDTGAMAMLSLIIIFVLLGLGGSVYHMSRTFCVKSTPVEGASMHSVVARSDEILVGKVDKESFVTSFLMAFSVVANCRRIFHVSEKKEAIQIIHGLRFYSMLWIILGHSYSFATQWLTYRNVDDTKAIPADIISQGIANGTLSVDTFFFISGLLLVYVAFNKMDKSNGKLNLVYFYLHRYLRMTPLMMVVIGICATLLPYMGSGPRWEETIAIYDKTCKQNWWINALYLQNFINTPQMCLNHTWFSAVDFQFYLISPILIYALYKSKRVGVCVLMTLILASAACTAAIIALNNFPGMPYISNIVPVELLNGYSSQVYIKPYCRIGAYIVGMLTGYLIHQTKGAILLSRRTVTLGWLVCAVLMLTVLYAMWPANTGQSVPSLPVAALYGSLSRTLWAVGLAWITVACLAGYGGCITSILSWCAIIPLSRLTYAAYIIHPVLMATFYGSRQNIFDYSPYLLMYFTIGNTVITYALSLGLSALFESPLISIERALLSPKRSSSSS